MDGPSALHLACARGHCDVVTYLHQTVGLNIETVGSVYGFSLGGAEYYWPINMDADSGIDWYEQPFRDEDLSIGYITFPDSYGIWGLDTHIRADDFPLELVNTCKVVTGTPLLLACVRGCANVIQYLLGAGADADSRGADGWTPLLLLQAIGHTESLEVLLAGARQLDAHVGPRTTPIKTRADRAGVQLEETPQAVRRDLVDGGPATRERAKAQIRAIQKSRVQRVRRAELIGTVRAEQSRVKETLRMATKRASETGSSRVYMCKTCGEPKKGHVCKLKF